MPSDQNQAIAGASSPHITMHNTLISASHGLNLGEKRLISIAISKINPQADSLPERPIRISALGFAQQYGLETQTAYEQLRNAQETLFRRYITHIEHRGPNGKKTYVQKMRWVSSIGYEQGGGEISVRFSPEVAQFLIQLRKHFTSYQLHQTSTLRSVYAWRLFENLKRFESTGVWRVEVDKFHALMETPKSYQRSFGEVRRWVLDPVISELQEKSGLDVTLETEKKGRKIVMLTFKFKQKQKSKIAQA